MFYLKFGAVYLTYFTAKFYIAHNRPSLNPPFIKRIGGYLRCVAVVAFIAFLTLGNWKKGEGEEAQVFSVDYNRGAIVFLALLIPALFGATEGYSTRERFPNTKG